jgi:inhibitor of cysteine peptidase
MNKLITLVLTAILFSIVAASASICDNAPCEPLINASAGENFTISLESTGSTGFNWWSQFDPQYLILRSSATESPSTSQGMVGVPEMQVFTFEAIKTGSTDVIMLYLQPWENGTIGKRQIYPVNISS